MKLTLRHDGSWRIRSMCSADSLAIAGWGGLLHASPAYRAALEHEGRLLGVASLVVAGRSGEIGEILISPTCNRANLERLLCDVFIRQPTQIGLRDVRIELRIGEPIAGQSTEYMMQQCEWGALSDSVQAVLLDQGYLVSSVDSQSATLIWNNPSH